MNAYKLYFIARLFSVTALVWQVYAAPPQCPQSIPVPYLQINSDELAEEQSTLPPYAWTTDSFRKPITPSPSTRTVIVVVIDQFSAHYIAKLLPHLKGGIGLLAREGVQFVNAFYDHAIPATGPGHYLLSTGTYGSVHGIVNNSWFDNKGNLVACDDDTPENAAVFAPDGSLYKYGKSARLSLVDTLSDQLVMHSYPHARNKVWSVSIKSRAAIAMAGKLGKALWLDEKTKHYTSSKAYFKRLPNWLTNFNKHLSLQPHTLTWQLFHPVASHAYRFDYIKNYIHSTPSCSFIGKPIDFKGNKGEIYSATPHANKDLINLALTVFDKNYSDKKSERFILWLSLSSLDKVGHAYGPHSIEAIDMIYHMDAQLKVLMDKIYERVPKEEVLFILTADHGIQPLPELMKQRGFSHARRQTSKDLTTGLNKVIKEAYGIENVVNHFKEPQLYLDQNILSSLAHDTKEKIYKAIKDYLTSIQGIRKVWTFEELQNAIFPSYDLDKYLARQLYKGRSGQIIYSVNPYTLIDKHEKGTSHVTQYAYDTQVPLIFYQKGRFNKKRITTNVFIPQVSVTLATLLNVPRPSAATANVLPGLKL